MSNIPMQAAATDAAVADTVVLETPVTKRSKLSTLLAICVYVYVATIIAIWLLIRVAGDRWWLATLIVYGPRWIYAAPICVLLPAAMLIRIRLIVPLAIGSFVAIFSLMGFFIPWRTWGNMASADLRVMTYNIEQFKASGEDFSALVEHERPDVIAIQECTGQFPWTDWWRQHQNWHTVHHGALLVASRFPIKNVEYSFSHWPTNRKPVLNGIYCVVSAPQGDFGFCNVHLDTPRRALSAVLDSETVINLNNIDYADYRLACRERESEDLRKWLSGFSESKIVAGDFNLASDGLIFRNDWKLRRDAFRWAGWGFGFTKQTVIREREYGLRIDYVLTESDRTPTRSWIGPDLGSDHLPLFAEIAANP
jgi:endonuclease/exonuclease/phosphatase (EEP) superfamily protein YafD